MRSLFIIIAGVLIFTSCTKTLEEEPKSIASENFYNTPAEIEAGLNAIYNPLRTGACIGALYTAQVEIYSDYMYGRGSHAPLNEYAGLDNTNISRVGNMWEQFYQSIRNANIVIRELNGGKNISKEQLAGYLGEARFLRGLSYFYLVRNWGGVPLRTENNIDSIDLKRSSKEAIYDFIIEDLKFAENNLPQNPRLIGTPSAWSAKTVLAEVYMHLESWTEAHSRLKEVIESNKFSLVPVTVADDFDKLYGPDLVSVSEEIFYLKFSRQGSNQGFNYIMYAHYPGSGYFPPGGFYTFYSDAEANPFIKAWDKEDLRYQYNWYSKTFGLGPNTIVNKKYKDLEASNGNNAGNDYPMYRFADVLLYYAEVESRINNSPTPDAMEKLNMVHRRAYGKNPSVADPVVDFHIADYNTQQAFQELVLRERGYENVSEGKRWLDLKRLGIAKEVIQTVKGKTVADKFMLWPIPTAEFNYNKAIDQVKDQNPGY